MLTVGLGNVGAVDTEGGFIALQTSPKGNDYVSFSFAVPKGIGKSKETDWYKCVAFGEMAEKIVKAGVKQGSRLQITGNLTLDSYEKADNTKGISPSIRILDWKYVGGISNGNASGGQGNNAAPQEAEAGSNSNAGIPFTDGTVVNLDDLGDDDLPF